MFGFSVEHELPLLKVTPMFSPSLYVVPALVVLAFALLTATVRILREYERAVVFTLGRFRR